MNAKTPLHKEAVFVFTQKASSYRGAYRVPLFSLSVGICVSVSACATFVVFAECKSCTMPVSTNPGSTEEGEYGLTRGTWFSRTVSRWSRSPGWCGSRGVFWVGRCFFPYFFHGFAFPNSHIQSSQRRLGEGAPTDSQSATENSRPPIPTRCIVQCALS